ncbi:hypothetical protein PR003_g24671 [Phytophthora rubi]|uniref:Uncharacterized protein n=1 Tax=Phytophthora rubi TaxID=129364 RepID=A0A6A4CKY6_9STRA|nr:hypothetical protein PR003_g24671 [Phytophthora rubi]
MLRMRFAVPPRTSNKDFPPRYHCRYWYCHPTRRWTDGGGALGPSVAAGSLASAEVLGFASTSEILVHAALPDAVGSTGGVQGMAALGEPVKPFRFFFPAAADAAVTIPRLDFVCADAVRRGPTRALDREGEADGAAGEAAVPSTTMTSTAAPTIGVVSAGASATLPVVAVYAEVIRVATGAVTVLGARLVPAADTVDWLHGAGAGDDMMMEPRGHELKVKRLARTRGTWKLTDRDLSCAVTKSLNDHTDRNAVCQPKYKNCDAVAAAIVRVKKRFQGAEVKEQAGDVSSAYRHVCIHSQCIHLFGGRLHRDAALVIDMSAATG